MIHLHNIHKSFGNLHVLKGIDLTINKGEIVSIVGPSGAGKTTLLQVMGTLYRPDEGTIEMVGTDITRLSKSALSKFRNRHIGFIFQFFNLLPTLTALENVSAALEPLDKGAVERREQAMDMLEAVGIAHLASNFPSQMSGGEQQRVSIARAMVKQPPVILADEPTGALDHKNATQVLECLTRLQQQIGTTVIVATHDPIVISYATETWEMCDGAIEVGCS